MKVIIEIEAPEGSNITVLPRELCVPDEGTSQVLPVANPMQLVDHELCSGFDATCFRTPCFDCDLTQE
jgi:hypothetical protein